MRWIAVLLLLSGCGTLEERARSASSADLCHAMWLSTNPEKRGTAEKELRLRGHHCTYDQAVAVAKAREESLRDLGSAVNDYARAVATPTPPPKPNTTVKCESYRLGSSVVTECK